MQNNPETPLSERQAIAHIKIIARDLFPSDYPAHSPLRKHFKSPTQHYKTAPYTPVRLPLEKTLERSRESRNDRSGRKAKRRPIFESRHLL